MELTRETVQAIAELARLELTEDEIDLYTAQLSQILDHFTHLQTLDTTQVEPLTSVLPIDTVLRADVSAAALPPEAVIANAPQAELNQFQVRAVLEE